MDVAQAHGYHDDAGLEVANGFDQNNAAIWPIARQRSRSVFASPQPIHPFHTCEVVKKPSKLKKDV